MSEARAIEPLAVYKTHDLRRLLGEALWRRIAPGLPRLCQGRFLGEDILCALRGLSRDAAKLKDHADLCAAGVGAPHIRQRLYWVADSEQPGLEGYRGHVHDGREPGRVDAHEAGPTAEGGCAGKSVTILCRDGRCRRIPSEPAFFPLAHGVSARVVRLRGYGNAIVPPLAATFVRVYMGETKAGGE